MRRRWIGVTAALVVLGLVIGASTLLAADSPYNRNVDVESYPVGPETPASINSTSAADYAISYEERLLFNDLIASRGNNLDARDRVITNCRGISVSNAGTGEFRIRLECRGGIDDTLRLFEPGEFTYSVAYTVTDSSIRQTDIRDYPFSGDRNFNDERK